MWSPEDRRTPGIEAIQSFRYLCSFESQDSIDNVLLELYKKSGRIQEEAELLEQKLKTLEHDTRYDVLEERFQIERYCELVWTILNEKKIDELDKDKNLGATLPPDADTSSAKSSLDEDENTSSISDALTYDTEEVDPETSLKAQETAANDAITVEACDKIASFLNLFSRIHGSDVCSEMSSSRSE
ncbi:hypothetical protein Bca4012_018555 [Brassica carinata]